MSLPKSGTKAALITRLVTSLETSFRVSMDRFESQETRRKALDELKVSAGGLERRLERSDSSIPPLLLLTTLSTLRFARALPRSELVPCYRRSPRSKEGQ